jgi:hypothetical protein
LTASAPRSISKSASIWSAAASAFLRYQDSRPGRSGRHGARCRRLFTRYDDSGRAQFSLQNYESTQFSADALRTLTTHGLTFLLDVPRVDHGERVFMQMSELAKRFADTLQGALVDDNRQPLSESQLDHIRREFIGKPQATMASFGLNAAGSPQALRLFS